MSDRRLCVHVWRYRTLNLCDMCWRWEAEAAEKRAEDAIRERDEAREENEHFAARINELIHAEEALAASQALTQRLRTALERVVAWELPKTGEFWCGGKGRHLPGCPGIGRSVCGEVSYGALYGSNGERDFILQIARAALAESPDHVAPAPEADPKWDPCICGHSRVNHPDGPCDGICNCRKFEPRSAQEATASPAPEVACICPGCPRTVPSWWVSGMCAPCANEDCDCTDPAAPPEEAAPQAQAHDTACGCFNCVGPV